jgi:hypothetical protein
MPEAGNLDRLLQQQGGMSVNSDIKNSLYDARATNTSHVGGLARSTRVDRLTAGLGLRFGEAIVQPIAGADGINQFETLLNGHAICDGGFDTAMLLPTFNKQP